MAAPWNDVCLLPSLDDEGVIEEFLAACRGLISACEKADSRCRGRGRGTGSACEKDHQVETTMELGVVMQQRSLEPNGSTDGALVSACEKAY